MEKHMRLRVLISISIVIIFILLVVFNATKPDEIGAGGILLVFTLLYFLSFFVVLILYRILFKVHMNVVSSSGQFMMVATVASVPVLILALHSLDQLFMRDLLILFGLSGVTIFYWLKRG